MRQQRYSSDPARQARIDYENELEQMLEKHEAELARRPVLRLVRGAEFNV